jgi:uncharacterized protein YkwD
MLWFSVTFLVAVLLSLHVGVAAAAPQDDAGYIARVLDLTNAERQKAGLPPLAFNAQLGTAAQNYSQVLASTGCFEHTCGSVPDFGDRDRQAGYNGWSAIGENIAAGYQTPEAVVSGWMESPDHRANILSPKYTEIGVGLVTGGGRFGTYWTQEFGARPGGTVEVAPAPVPSDDAGAPADDGSAADWSGGDDQ